MGGDWSPSKNDQSSFAATTVGMKPEAPVNPAPPPVDPSAADAAAASVRRARGAAATMLSRNAGLAAGMLSSGSGQSTRMLLGS